MWELANDVAVCKSDSRFNKSEGGLRPNDSPDLTNHDSLQASPYSAGRCYGNVRAVACVWALKRL